MSERLTDEEAVDRFAVAAVNAETKEALSNAWRFYCPDDHAYRQETVETLKRLYLARLRVLDPPDIS